MTPAISTTPLAVSSARADSGPIPVFAVFGSIPSDAMTRGRRRFSAGAPRALHESWESKITPAFRRERTKMQHCAKSVIPCVQCECYTADGADANGSRTVRVRTIGRVTLTLYTGNDAFGTVLHFCPFASECRCYLRFPRFVKRPSGASRKAAAATRHGVGRDRTKNCENGDRARIRSRR